MAKSKLSLHQGRLLQWALLVMLLPTPTLCGSMAAWWTDIGPSFAMQNASTGLITYSLCHSNNTPLYPVDPPLTFDTTYAPKNGTSLAATGWFDKTTTWASLFYQNNNDDIVNAIYTCDFKTGRYMHQDSLVISDRAGTPAPHAQTGLSVTLLGEQEGYRVFFQDRSRALQSLKFTQVESWSYGGPVSTNTHRSGMAISSMFSGVRNVTVVTPRNEANMEVTRLNIDGAWHISTFPTPLSGRNITNLSNATSFPYDNSTTPSFTLDAWSGNPKALGIAIDTLLTRHVFYMGTDGYPREVASFVVANGGSEGPAESAWRAQPKQATEFWPRAADGGDADFAIASDIGESVIRLYYFVDEVNEGGRRLVEARYRNGNWDPAAPLQTANVTAAATAGDGTGNGEAGQSVEGGSGGLSTGAQAGIGVGVAVGVLLLGAALGWWVLRWRKGKAGKKVDEEGAAGGSSGGDAPGSEGSAADGTRVDSGMSQALWETDVKDTVISSEPRELDSPDPKTELPESGDRNELPTNKNVPELP